ncbi:MAG: hypothetical protein NC131_06400 [Roseburia sp.]|nr:hypothetical protein [Roseburia sp.]
MDIRNIKENPPVVENGKYLEAIYDLQKKLMEGYIGKIEKNLPPYPISINSEKGQVVLKDFSSRVIEETAEGYESTSAALDLLHKYGFNIDNMTPKHFDMLINHLQNSNEEQADAFAFFTELMLYANIGPEDIYGYVNKMFNRPEDAPVDLEDLMNIGFMECVREEWAEQQMNLFKVVEDYQLEAHNKDVDHVNSYIPGFRNMNDNLHANEDHMLWKVAYHLNVSRNYLKNKTWKQTQELTDGLRYQAEVVKGFIAYCGYLQAMGFTPATFFVLFFKKHMVNRFRQKSGY